MRALLLVLALFCAPALADEMVLRAGANEIHLAESPCDHAATVALLKPEWLPMFRNAWAVLNGKHWHACWLPDQEARAVVLLFEDGDVVRIDARQFKYSAGV
jgi:hypothetical protein